jgi:hypothetical protein
MRLVLNFARNWSRCYQVLHYRNGLDCLIPCAMACGLHVGDPALKERHGKAS